MCHLFIWITKPFTASLDRLLYLYYYEGYSIRELTAILKRKESTLQTQLAAGRRKLKEELKKAGEIPQNWEREGK